MIIGTAMRAASRMRNLPPRVIIPITERISMNSANKWVRGKKVIPKISVRKTSIRPAEW